MAYHHACRGLGVAFRGSLSFMLPFLEFTLSAGVL
jgi:hypothetical protein